MPREPKPLVREGGFAQAEKFFVLAFEGAKSEKYYFEAFRQSEYFNDSGEIETIPIRKKKRDDSHPIHVKNILLDAKNMYSFRDSDEFWLIIDRDYWTTMHHVDFQKIADECKAYKNVFLALSNPCFEMWLVFHLTDMKSISDADKALLRRNEAISQHKNFIDVFLAELIGDGRGYNKKPNPAVFLPKIGLAVRNAKAAASPFKEDFPHDLGSDVYLLIEKLLKQ